MTSKHNYGVASGILCTVFFSSLPMICSAATSVEVQENIDTLVRTNKCVECNLAGAELNRLNLAGADLRGADLSSATFFLADLSSADLRGAIMRGSQLGGADLADADLRQADLRGVKISGAYLVGARIDGTFTDVSVTEAEGFQEVVEKTYIPDDTVPKKVPENQNVTIGDRRDFGPVPPQISQAEKTMADSQENVPVMQEAPPVKQASPVNELVVKYEPAKPAEEIAVQDQLQPAAAVQNGADLRSEEAPETGIVESSLEVAEEPAAVSVAGQEKGADVVNPAEKIESAEREVPSAQSVVEGGERTAGQDEQKNDGNDPLPDPGTIEERPAEASSELQALEKQVSKSRKCYRCNLAGSDFSGKNLDGADLEGSDFSGANLENVDFEDANLKGVSFKNARLVNAKFNGADLYRADFSGADLTGAEFKKATIDDTNFQNAIGYGGLMTTQPQ